MLAKRQALFMARLRESHCHKHIENIFLYFSAPILRGAKPATLITLQPHRLTAWQERQNALRKATGLKTYEVRNRNGTLLLLIYDETAMRVLLRKNENISLLALHGYPAGCDPGEIFTYLQFRFWESKFPHEIGVFLGYPIEDVWGFILNEGKNCVCCRYWKVYHDLEKAQEMFRRIDEAQDYAIDLLCKMMPIHITANLLKAV
jgi:hypothetical protein